MYAFLQIEKGDIRAAYLLSNLKIHFSINDNMSLSINCKILSKKFLCFMTSLGQ